MSAEASADPRIIASSKAAAVSKGIQKRRDRPKSRNYTETQLTIVDVLAAAARVQEAVAHVQQAAAGVQEAVAVLQAADELQRAQKRTPAVSVLPIALQAPPTEAEVIRPKGASIIRRSGNLENSMQTSRLAKKMSDTFNVKRRFITIFSRDGDAKLQRISSQVSNHNSRG